MYMLELEDSCYYIGITSRHIPLLRIAEHFSGNGAKWTKNHRPKKVMFITDLGYITENEAKAREENATLVFMKLYGYNHVRGGSLNYSGNYVKYNNKFFQTNVLINHWA